MGSPDEIRTVRAREPLVADAEGRPVPSPESIPLWLETSAPSEGASPSEDAGRYVDRTLLGRGGMGDVFLAYDRRVRRRVALKVLREDVAGDPEYVLRFRREALVQGQLEHPSVVPVYDLGAETDGGEFIAMKRVSGETLAATLEGLRELPPDARFATRSRLVSALAQVCQAVAYAHSRGVVHRDIKPANIMLGAFGEVYLLDWGIAKVRGEAAVGGSVDRPDQGADGLATADGVVMGTPTYMAPEQLQGAPVNEATDIFALGAVLFEILTLSRFRAAQDNESAGRVAHGLGPSALPSRRTPEANIPPELDDICARALAPLPRERFPSARALYDALAAYLDGARDEVTRCKLAARHLSTAREALRLLPGAERPEAVRKEALRALGSAVSLDPSNEAALLLLADLVDADAALPPEAERALGEQWRAEQMRTIGSAAPIRLLWILALPLPLWMGVRMPEVLAAVIAVLLATLGFAYWVSTRSPWSVGRRHQVIVLLFLLGSVGGLVALSAGIAPFLVAPAGACMAVVLVRVATKGSAVRSMAAVLLYGLAILVPACLQYLGVLPPTFEVRGGTITVLPVVFAYPELPTWVFLLVVPIVQALMMAVLIHRSLLPSERLERRHFARAYRLKQALSSEPPVPPV